ncbi:MAG: hypothetical protein JSS61_05010 [Verrucomicrobia bacterium]|nr:hypothetical protein [Verrucomicrobiota bacterium]
MIQLLLSLLCMTSFLTADSTPVAPTTVAPSDDADDEDSQEDTDEDILIDEEYTNDDEGVSE